VNPTAAIGALLGLLAGLGLALSLSRLPALRRPTLEDRLGPYLVDRRDDRRRVVLFDRTVTPFPTLERLLRPHLSRAGEVLERLLGGTASVRRRLDQAGGRLSVQEFRVEQVVWGVVVMTGAVLLSVVLLARGTASSAAAMVVFSLSAGVAGVLARDQRLSRQVKEREARMLAEFPTIADLLALSVAAGEGAVGALERVARASQGELSRELARALGEARTGASLVQALEGVADRTSLAPLARFVDGMSVAIERGTPLADVLRAQAADVREVGKRALLEAGGRKEIAMMVPVAFTTGPSRHGRRWVWARGNAAQVGPAPRRGAGPGPCRRSIERTEVAETVMPSFQASPTIRNNPHRRSSRASTTSTMCSGRARPVRPGCGYVQRRATSCRCHGSNVGA